jgi:nicotinamidase/pyrazinamidase
MNAAPVRDQVTGRRRSLGKVLGLERSDALLLVDLQQDFMPGGALPVPDADAIIPNVNAYITAFAMRHLPIFLTRDWHPENHCSFVAAGGRWPPHCVAGTPGAKWAGGLNVVPGARILSKGTDPAVEAYSGFAGTPLLVLLRDLGVRRLFVAGVATDYCVHDTVIDARAQGYRVVLLADAIRGVDAEPEDVAEAIADMVAHGATLVQVHHRTRAIARTV